MVGHTIAELFGHIMFSFTRSVAEHYNLEAGENHSALFGYNALDDTGKEWYCQPVDEVIYQEYSNSKATVIDYLPSSSVNARFIDASSTDDSDQAHEVGKVRAMAWKQLRPSISRTVWNSFYFGFFISVLSATFVGVASIIAYYFSFQTQLICITRPKVSIPIKLQWIKTVSEVFSIWFIYLPSFLNFLFYFRPFQISGVRFKMFFLCLFCYVLDSAYRIAMQAFGISHSKLTPTQRIPAMVVYYTNVCIQFYILAIHFCPRARKKQFKLILLLIVVCVSTCLTAELLARFVYPAYVKQDISGKIIIAIFTPLVTVLFKGITRICVQRLWCRNSHPGTSFVLLVPLYCGSAVMMRLLQVDLQSLESVTLIGVIHGIAEVIERSTMVFIDHLYNQVVERRAISWGGFRTPRRERLAADICIMSMLYESSAVISVNGFLYLYQYFNTNDNSPLQLLQSFAITTSVPLAIEWFFTGVSIAIETRYQNMPIIAVWRKRWKRHVTVAVLNIVMISVWASTSLLITVQGRFANSTKEHREMPFSSGL